MSENNDAPSLLSRLGAVAGICGGVSSAYARIRVSTPTPIGGPTAWIEPPRRALAIRAAEGEIAEGLQQKHVPPPAVGGEAAAAPTVFEVSVSVSVSVSLCPLSVIC